MTKDRLSDPAGLGPRRVTSWMIGALTGAGLYAASTAEGAAAFLTWLAGVCAALYVLIATPVGGYFGLGFIWAAPGGGWEHPVPMMALFFAFAAHGGGRFSVDAALDASGDFPPALRRAAFRDPA